MKRYIVKLGAVLSVVVACQSEQSVNDGVAGVGSQAGAEPPAADTSFKLGTPLNNPETGQTKIYASSFGERQKSTDLNAGTLVWCVYNGCYTDAATQESAVIIIGEPTRRSGLLRIPLDDSGAWGLVDNGRCGYPTHLAQKCYEIRRSVKLFERSGAPVEFSGGAQPDQYMMYLEPDASSPQQEKFIKISYGALDSNFIRGGAYQIGYVRESEVVFYDADASLWWPVAIMGRVTQETEFCEVRGTISEYCWSIDQGELVEVVDLPEATAPSASRAYVKLVSSGQKGWVNKYYLTHADPVVSGDLSHKLYLPLVYGAPGQAQVPEHVGRTAGDLRLWPHGVVYYAWGPNISSATKQLYLQGCEEWAQKANVRCLLRDKEPVYLIFDALFRPFSLFLGESTVTGMPLATGTLRVNSSHYRSTQYAIILHELGHGLGRDHEQMRPDRDQYITVHQDRIIEACKYNFDIVPQMNTTVAYDLASIMHYGRWDCSNDLRAQLGWESEDLATFSVKQGDASKIGNEVLSPLDYEAMAALYPPAKVTGQSCQFDVDCATNNCGCQRPGGPRVCHSGINYCKIGNWQTCFTDHDCASGICGCQGSSEKQCLPSGYTKLECR